MSILHGVLVRVEKPITHLAGSEDAESVVYFRYLTSYALLKSIVVLIERLVAIVTIVEALARDLKEDTLVDLVIRRVALIYEPVEWHLRLEVKVLAGRL